MFLQPTFHVLFCSHSCVTFCIQLLLQNVYIIIQNLLRKLSRYKSATFSNIIFRLYEWELIGSRMNLEKVVIKVQNKVHKHKMTKINFLWVQGGVKRPTETKKSIWFVVSILLSVWIASFITSTLLMRMKWCDLTQILCLMGIERKEHKHRHICKIRKCTSGVLMGHSNTK